MDWAPRYEIRKNEIMSGRYILVKPFYFLVPFWGERYRNYFLNYCLASLLAPNNLPLLDASDGHRMLIATTKSDWDAIELEPSFQELRQYATPQLIEIPSPPRETSPGGVEAIRYQNVCQKLLVEAAAKDRVYGAMLWPDIMLSDGYLGSLIERAKEGHSLVLCAALRQHQEDVLEDLRRRGILNTEMFTPHRVQPLALPPRLLAELQVKHLHPEVMRFEEGSAEQPFLPPYRYWRAPDQNGIIIHTFFLQPVLMDYSAVEKHDADCLNEGVFENIYIGRNFSNSRRVHIVQESDELGILSLTPGSVDGRPPDRLARQRRRTAFLRSCSIRASMAFYARKCNDSLKRDMFRVPIRWHSSDLDAGWSEFESEIEDVVRDSVGDYFELADGSQPKSFPSLLGLRWRYFFKDLIVACNVGDRLPFILIGLRAGLRVLRGDRRQLGRIIDQVLKAARSVAATLA